MTHHALKKEEELTVDLTQLAALTQFPSPSKRSGMDAKEKVLFITEKFREILRALGLDLEDDSLADTPRRVAEMYVHELFQGLETEHFPKVTFFEDKMRLNTMIAVKTEFISMCEHHFLPMHGIAHVAYIPNGKLIGLSKIPRIVNYFAKRPQLQERLTAQVADSLSTLLNTQNVAVSMTAEHFCVKARGAEDPNGHTTTRALLGKFQTDACLREEFLHFC